MKSSKALAAAAMMSAIADSQNLIPSNLNIADYKAPLTKKQQKARDKAKRARKARKINRKNKK